MHMNKEAELLIQISKEAGLTVYNWVNGADLAYLGRRRHDRNSLQVINILGELAMVDIFYTHSQHPYMGQQKTLPFLSALPQRVGGFPIFPWI